MKTFRPKLIDIFKDYSKKQLASDVVAGIIVAIIALPLSIALAIASGVSPEKGLYTAIVAGFVIALLDENNNGFIMNSVHNIHSNYCYAKEIKGGKCSIQLSEEEQVALEKALTSR